MRIFKRASVPMITLGVGILCLATSGNTADETVPAMAPADCYRLPSQDSVIADTRERNSETIWCYRDLASPAGARIVYNIDSRGTTRPELSFIVERDGTIAHASRLAGEVTFHRTKGEFNPFGVPTEQPKDAARVDAPRSATLSRSLMRTIGVYQQVERIPVREAELKEGTFKVSVAKENLPWKGYGFPLKSGKLHNGENSPTAKFDKFVLSRTQSNPGAQDWEKKNHYFSGVKWSGHCNGWAAASVLRKEPRASVMDPQTGIVFEVADLKGYWVEHDYCPRIAFFGKRYWGKGESEQSDIKPAEFHNVITYYIGELKKPVLVDLHSDESVQNRVYSGYTMEIDKRGKHRFKVTATMTVHDYDQAIGNGIGVAKSRKIEYKYTLKTDDSGRVIDSDWESENPDFLWVPLAPANCDDSNPGLQERWIEEILRLPPRVPAPFSRSTASETRAPNFSN